MPAGRPRKYQYPLETDSQFDIFGRRLRFVLKSRGLSHRALCERTGITRDSYYYHQRNGTLPSCEDVIAMARYLHISADWLLGLSDDQWGKIRWKK